LANVDGLEIQHRPDGRFSYSASTREARGAVTKLLNIVTGSSELEIADRTAVLSSLTQRLASTGAVSPAVSMRLTLEGLLKLSVDDSIRRMRTAGYVDPRALEIDSGAFDAAARLGEASVILTIRDAHAGGRLSAASQAALQRSNRAAANAVLASSRVGVIKQDFSRFGAVAANLNLEELNRLRASADPRLLSIELNRPVAVPNLATSGPTMNVASAHNAGYVASGQGIIVFDGGMQVDHPFFGNRVVFQACFGTSENIDGINYTSVCPDGNAGNNWDSPPGTPNAAAPVFPFYNHGTHVAGIAAGNQSPPTALRGTGPAANIYAVQLFSRLEGTSEPRVLNQDLLAALQLAASSLPSLPQPQRQPFTLTMSFGAGLFVVPCSLLAAYSTAVASLRTAGVPVLASTGNDGFDYGINFPACLPGVIKVSSVANDGVGNTRSTFGGPRAANTADPSAFPQQTFWFAPGGGNGTGVTSSILAGQFGNDAGTSMAAPQMAGLYAAAKSAVPEWTETDITAYFVANASVSVPVVIGGTTAFSYRRISLPAY
jgi:hypothetical protein